MNEFERICVECQECCKWLTFVLDVPDREYFTEVYEARGCEVTKDKVGDNRIIVKVPQVCQHLVEGVGCTIYEKRPRFCRAYDGREDYFMYKQCKLPLEIPKDDR